MYYHNMDYQCLYYDNQEFTYKPPVMEGHSAKKTFLNISDPLITNCGRIIQCDRTASSTIKPAKPYCTTSHQPHHCLHTVLHATHRKNTIYNKYILQETRPPQIPNCIFSSHDNHHTIRRRYDR